MGRSRLASASWRDIGGQCCLAFRRIHVRGTCNPSMELQRHSLDPVLSAGVWTQGIGVTWGRSPLFHPIWSSYIRGLLARYSVQYAQRRSPRGIGVDGAFLVDINLVAALRRRTMA